MGNLFPSKFTLTIEEDSKLGWVITSDAHKGFMQIVHPEEGLPEGLRQVPMGLRMILAAQMDADRETKG